MTDNFIPFDDMRRRVEDVLEQMGAEAVPGWIDRVYLVRDLFGKLRISVSQALEENEECRMALQRLAGALGEVLGAHGYPAEDGVLFVEDALLATLKDTAREIRPHVFLADRLVTGQSWWTVDDPDAEAAVPTAARITLYSVKGGVGRSTTAAVLAWHLARKGERVLTVDLDLESPGLSSAMLEPGRQPKFGITDWFVEDLVGQGGCVIEDMTAVPTWAESLDGDALVAPAHGADPGEFLAKLGRVYMDTRDTPWTKRLDSMLRSLEAECRPTVVLIESRSGLHDIAAATVTDLDAEVLLFATDSESTWADYGILFRHWHGHGLAARIRNRLSIVSALTPVPDKAAYLRRFRARAWDLFQDHLYDAIDADADADIAFSFDLEAEDAPHYPLEIDWTLGLAAGASLYQLRDADVEPAYRSFLERLDRLIAVDDGDAAR